MRRISALLATGLMTTATLLAFAPAQAQSSNIVDSKVADLASSLATGESTPAEAASSILDDKIGDPKCIPVRAALDKSGVDTTGFTRSELVKNLAEKRVDNPELRSSSYPVFNIVGDLALKCKLVKSDPTNVLTSAVDATSILSNRTSLPDFSTLLYLVDLPEGLDASVPELSSKPEKTTDSEGSSIKLSS